MASITFFRVGVEVCGGGEVRRQPLVIQRYASVLLVCIGFAGLVVEGRAGKHSEMAGLIAQHGIERLVLMEDEEDVLDLLGSTAAGRNY